MARLPELHPEAHHVLVNAGHPLVRGEVEHFVGLVRDAEGLVCDGDGTLWAASQWVGARALMSEEGRRADHEDALTYFARPHHDDVGDVAFILRSVGRLSEAGATRQQLREIGSSLPPRAGARQLFQSFGYPRTAVVSYGMHDVIRHWLWLLDQDRASIHTEIFALQLNWQDGTRFQGSILPTVVTDGNKGYCRRAFCGARGILPERTLVVGDGPTDILMMGPDVPGVFIIPKVDPQPERMAHRLARLEAMWNQVACMLVSDSLEPLAEMRQS